LVLIGFMLTFYIQLHHDFKDDVNSEAPFTLYYKVPLKTLAMFVGELEYGDFPFQSGQFWNHLTFILFVYFIGMYQ
jgi:hypothetical protein